MQREEKVHQPLHKKQSTSAKLNEPCVLQQGLITVLGYNHCINAIFISTKKIEHKMEPIRTNALWPRGQYDSPKSLSSPKSQTTAFKRANS